MKKIILITVLLVTALFVQVHNQALAAPTVTIVPDIKVNGLAGNGTICVEVDNNGQLQPAASLAACGSGGGSGASSEWGISGGNLFATTTPTISSVVIGQTASTSIPASPGIILNKAGTAVFSSSVGIGTRAPSTTLHVVGTFRSSATSTFDSDTILSNLTANTVPYLDASKILRSSAVTPTELGYVSGVTSAIQTQLDGKQASGSYALQSTTISAGGLLTGGGDLSTNRTITFASSSLNLGTMSIVNSPVPVINGGTATSTTPADAQLLVGQDLVYKLLTATAGTGISIATSTSAITFTNSGVTSIVAGSGISIDQGTGAVTITNTGGGGGSSSDWVGSGTTLTASSTYNLVQVFGTASSSQLRSPSSTLATINGTISFTGAVNSSSTFTNSAATILGSTLGVGGQTSLQSASSTNLGVTTNFTIGADTINDLTGTGLQVSGLALQATLGTSVDLTTEVTGVLPIANGGTATSTTPTDLQVLVGNNTNYSLRKLTAGSGVTIATSTTAITFSATGGTSTSTKMLSLLDDTVTPNPNGTETFFENFFVTAANDNFGGQVLRMGLATSSQPTTLDGIYGRKTIPPGYDASSSSVRFAFTSTDTTGNAVYYFKYRCVAVGESFDQSTFQRSASTTIALPGTTHLSVLGSIPMTASDCVAGDVMQWAFQRDGSDSNDTGDGTIILTLDMFYDGTH